MSQLPTALDILKGAYTDSEPESDTESSKSMNKFLFNDACKESRGQSKLVSYATKKHHEGGMSYFSDSSDEGQEDKSPGNKGASSGAPPLSPDSFHRSLLNLKRHEIQLPPQPTGRCSKVLLDEFSEYYAKKSAGTDMTAAILQRKAFRNPSMSQKLIEHFNIDEHGTNYPPGTYDPYFWGQESFYDHLAKQQDEEMEKRDKEKKKRTKVGLMSGTVVKKPSVSNLVAAKCKSECDAGVTQMPVSLKPASLPTVLPVPTRKKFRNKHKKGKAVRRNF